MTETEEVEEAARVEYAAPPPEAVPAASRSAAALVGRSPTMTTTTAMAPSGGDLAATYEAARRMETLPLSKASMLPLVIATLVPTVAVGATQLSLKESLPAGRSRRTPADEPQIGPVALPFQRAKQEGAIMAEVGGCRRLRLGTTRFSPCWCSRSCGHVRRHRPCRTRSPPRHWRSCPQPVPASTISAGVFGRSCAPSTRLMAMSSPSTGPATRSCIASPTSRLVRASPSIWDRHERSCVSPWWRGWARNASVAS